MTAGRLHIDPAHLAADDYRDPATREKVVTLVAHALKLGGNPAAAACILIAAAGTFAETTDNPGCVLACAWSIIDEEMGEFVRREASGAT